jgi:hypothetical protein
MSGVAALVLPTPVDLGVHRAGDGPAAGDSRREHAWLGQFCPTAARQSTRNRKRLLGHRMRPPCRDEVGAGGVGGGRKGACVNTAARTGIMMSEFVDHRRWPSALGRGHRRVQQVRTPATRGRDPGRGGSCQDHTQRHANPKDEIKTVKGRPQRPRDGPPRRRR